MTNITVLTNEEEFIRFLDPELCEITETIEKDGLRTLSFKYFFQDMIEDKKLFKIGNKVWVYGDPNLADCLYVINTSVTQDIYQENCFTCEMEEVLVELNYAPLFTQNELSTSNGFTFSTNQNDEEYSVLVNWNSLNYWFGEYFNIGVVQKCLSDYNAKIGLSGTINLMTLLRKIEEETGNIFVTRYEKDCLNNTIHRYLDFLNPISVSKPWVLNIEYDFLDISNTSYVYTEDDDETTDTYEDVYDKDDMVDWSDDYTPVININPSNIEFRITNELGQILGTDGLVYDETRPAEPLKWTSNDIGFEDNQQSALITLKREKEYIGLTVNEKTFEILDNPVIGDTDKAYTTTDYNVLQKNQRLEPSIPDDSWFEMYDTQLETPVYRTQINREIGHVHEEILDFGFNLDNITLEMDETETYTAISPVLLNEDEDDGLTRGQLSNLITRWQNLSVEKGDVVPMIVERITVQASSLSAAKSAMGTYNLSSNYWTRPYKPNDNIDSDTPANSTFEFWKATAYWKAPYTKNSGELHILTDAVLDTEYTHIQGRPDIRDGRDINTSRPKMGTVETTAEDTYVIYNLVTNKLREHQYPDFNITVDAANLIGYEYNNYDLHDKVYVKIPDMNELLTARVTKTTKEGHDVAKNTIELTNYSVNSVKQIQQNTFIEASNTSFKYPNTKNYTCRLVNMDYNADDPNSIQYPPNKLLSIQLYNVDENGNTTLTRKTYNKTTNKDGQITLPLKYDPGNYELVISFGGDEEYLDCSMSVEVNVSGTKKVATTTKKTTTTKQKTTKKTSTKKTSTSKSNAAKKNTSTKTRVVSGNPSKYVRKLALNIVGDSTGLAAAKKIVKYVDSHVKYELYANFHRSPDTVLKKGRANCCDQARLVLTLCDAAGCTEALTLKYVHVHNGSIGHVFCKIITNSSGKWRYVDTCKYGGKAWGNYVHGYGSPPGNQTTYPNRPF